MEEMIAGISTGLANGSWGLLFIMFGVGLTMSLNPCMGAMVPLVLGGTRRVGYSRSLMFMAGFTGILMVLGLGASSIGRVLTLPGWFWISFLGLLYLLTGLWLLNIKLPIFISGFYVSRNRSSLARKLRNEDGLNPAAMGMLSGLAPSPCTMPVVIAVSALALAKGKLLFGMLALGSFGLGHSLLISLAFLPQVRRLFKSNRFTRSLRPAFGVLLVLLSLYFLIGQPAIFYDGSATTIHSH